MCGISAVITNWMTIPLTDIFKDLFTMSTLRGYDSSGIMSITHTHQKASQLRWTTHLGTPVELLKYNKAAPNILSKENHGMKALIGHARSATIGDIKLENAHPFVFKDVAGVHNGTIRHPFPKEYMYDTDSESLYAMIDDIGIEETIKSLKGDPHYALIWVNEPKRTINILRNDKRPLYFLFNDAKDAILLSSEYYMVACAAFRREFNWAHTKIEAVKPNIHYEIPYDDWDGMKRIKEKELKPGNFSLPIKTFIEDLNEDLPWGVEQSCTTVLRGKGSKDYWDFLLKGKFPPKKGEEQEVKEIEIEIVKVEDQKVIPFQQNNKVKKKKHWYYGFKDIPYSLQQYESKLKAGCVICKKTPPLNSEITWKSPRIFECSSCLVKEQKLLPSIH